MQLLRAETLQCQAQVVDLAKWKLIAVAAVAVAGLGWRGGDAPDREASVLLLYAGSLIAAYVDVLIYGRLLALQRVGAQLRDHFQRETDQGRHPPGWEPSVTRMRAQMGDVFDHWVHAGSSLAAAVALPLLAYARWKAPVDWRLIFPLAGLLASAASVWVYTRGRERLVRLKREPEKAPSIRLSMPPAVSTPPPVPRRDSTPSYLR
jgi:hypothetical protein